jgi:hypothetical protein
MGEIGNMYKILIEKNARKERDNLGVTEMDGRII